MGNITGDSRRPIAESKRRKKERKKKKNREYKKESACLKFGWMHQKSILKTSGRSVLLTFQLSTHHHCYIHYYYYYIHYYYYYIPRHASNASTSIPTYYIHIHTYSSPTTSSLLHLHLFFFLSFGLVSLDSPPPVVIALDWPVRNLACPLSHPTGRSRLSS